MAKKQEQVQEPKAQSLGRRGARLGWAGRVATLWPPQVRLRPSPALPQSQGSSPRARLCVWGSEVYEAATEILHPSEGGGEQ